MSQADQQAPRPRRQPVKEFFTHVVTMPAWQRNLLVMAGLLAILGLVGQTMNRVSTAKPPEATMTSEGVSASSGGSSAPRSSAFADAPAPSANASGTIGTDGSATPTMTQRLAPWASRVGVGFVGGFVIGWAFRAFLKTMAFVTAAGVALIWTLSHFNVLHLDMNAAEEKFKSSTSWVSEQAERLKDSATALIPSSASSVFGMFLGFRRK